MRGVPIEKSYFFRFFGITPACAGSTFLRATVPDPSGDHPRVCGEYDRWAVNIFGKWGSPPRVRGVLEFLSLARLNVGITPACAGSTCS